MVTNAADASKVEEAECTANSITHTVSSCSLLKPIATVSQLSVLADRCRYVAHCRVQVVNHRVHCRLLNSL